MNAGASLVGLSLASSSRGDTIRVIAPVDIHFQLSQTQPNELYPTGRRTIDLNMDKIHAVFSYEACCGLCFIDRGSDMLV